MNSVIRSAQIVQSSSTGWRRIQDSRGYDWLVRLPLLLWLSFLAYRSGKDIALSLDRFSLQPEGASLLYANLLARGATLTFVLALFAFVVLRARPVRRAEGVLPRLIAGAGSFVPLAFMMFPPRQLSLTSGVLSAIIVLVGTALSVYVVFWLGRSFSMMPEARRLVVAGPYKLVRHPLYAAEQVAVFGAFIQFASWQSAVLLVAHILLQIRRMDYEEAVLRRAYPAYDAYAARTKRVIPGVY